MKQPDAAEAVLIVDDRATGLTAVIVVDDTSLGPSLGGVRMRPYATLDEAIAECRGLARSMTRKSAIAGLSLGGGKSVIVGDPATEKTPELLLAHGRLINVLEGRYIPGIDMGTDQSDMEVLARVCPVVSCRGADPSVSTALGVLESIRAAVQFSGVAHTLSGVHVGIQGVGHVGAALARMLVSEGARVTVADALAERSHQLAAELPVDVVPAADILTLAVDVLAPCATAGVISQDNLDGLRCAAIVGAANNLLADDDLAEDLAARGITLVPDFVASAGGVIHLEEELQGASRQQLDARVRTIGATALAVLRSASESGTSTVTAATQLAAARLQAARVAKGVNR